MFKEKILLPLISLSAGLIVLISFSAGLFGGLEYFFEDLLFSAKPISSEIVIVAIDNESINRIGQWPWPREIFAQAISKLEQAPPKVLGIDIIFSEPSRFGEKDDNFLAQALEKSSFPVILPTEASPLLIEEGKAETPEFLKPFDRFRRGEQTKVGHVNLILDPDGVARRFPISISQRANPEISFDAFTIELGKTSGLAVDKAQLGSIERIVYAAPAGSVRRIPFWRLLENEIGQELKDKIVLIGATAPDLHDEKLTPFGRGSPMSGVEIQANIVNMLIMSYQLRELPAPLASSWIILAALIPAFLFIYFKRALPAIVLSTAVGLAQIALVVVLFEQGVVSNFIHLNLSWIISTASLFSYQYFTLGKERRRLEQLFSRYVSPAVLADILRNPAAVKLGGEEKKITILFSDIRGFTTMAEKITPTELVRVLNQYFEAMASKILEHKGVVDKYIGDAIMAFWGAPLDDRDQADNAIKTSLAMIQALQDLNKKLQAVGDPEIKIGIGLYTGPAVVGNIGSQTRHDYTAIGDSVNVASRLESLNKEFGTTIIIGESTKAAAKGDYQFRYLGTVNVRGRSEPLKIYTPALIS